MGGPLGEMGLDPLQGMGGLGRIPEEDEDLYKVWKVDVWSTK